MDEEKKQGIFQAVRAFAILSGVGIYFVVFVGICLWLGMQADSLLDINPAGKLCGILIGFPGAIYTLYRRLKYSGII